MAGIRLILVCALAAFSAIAQNPVELPRVERPIVVDGDLADWPAGSALIDLQEQHQVWSQKDRPEAAWEGVADLSARIRLAYDAGHLWIGGQVRDDSLVPGEIGKLWHQGDAIELFLDFGTGPQGADPGAGSAEWVQLFFMPFSNERRWGQADWSVDPPVPTGVALTGVEAAFQRGREPDVYTFEAVVPFHNWPRFAGLEQIGVAVALDDFDENRPDRYQYMTWNGENPCEGREHFTAVKFGAGAPLVGAPPAGTVSAWLVENTSFLLVPLLGVAGLMVLLWGWSELNRRVSAFRPVGRVLGVAMLILGLALPGWLADARVDQDREQLEALVDDLVGVIGPMEGSLLGSYRGTERDQRLIELLDGGEIKPEQRFEYRTSVELAGPDAAAIGVSRRRLLGFDVRPYGVPLSIDASEVLNFANPVPRGKLNVVVAVPDNTVPVPSMTFLETPLILEIEAVGGGEDGESIAHVLELDGPFEPSSDPELERVGIAARTIDLEQPISSLRVTCLQGEGARLVGLTWVDALDDSRQEALALGVDTLGGVPTDLRAQWPRFAGFELPANRSVEFALDSERTDPFDKLWLIFHGVYRSRPGELLGVGSTACEVTVEFEGDVPPLLIPFRHQQSMFFEQDRYNRVLPTEPGTRVAFEWEGEDRERRLHFVREVDLPSGARPRALKFHSTGRYPVRFRSAVFGRAIEVAQTYDLDSPLERTESGGQRLRAQHREQLKGADFAVFRGDRLTASSFDVDVALEHSELPVDARRADLVDAAFARTVMDGAALVHESYRSLPGEPWSGAVLSVSRRDQGYGEFVLWLNRIGTALCLGALPVLLLLFSEALAVLKNLRLRLVSVLTVATLVPLLLLSIVLVQILEQDHEARRQEDLASAADGLSTEFESETQRVSESAKSWLADLVAQLRDRRLLREGEKASSAAIRGVRATMERQIPPTWRESGFLRFEFDPLPENEGGEPFSVFAGADDLQSLDSPLRSEPGMLLVWGTPLLGVRTSVDVPGVGTCALSVARLIDAAMLAGAGRGHAVVLTDLRGYPLEVAGSPALTSAAVMRHGERAEVFMEREQIGEELADISRSVVRRHETGQGTWIASYSMLRDAKDSPRMIVGIVDRDTVATIPLWIGRVPVRSFFLSVAGLVLLLSIFLSFVVTTRISKPIDRLERGAQAIRRGELDVRVQDDEGGQIGRLTRSFNDMAGDLRGRIQDLRLLNRGIQDLTRRLELGDVVMSSVGFYGRHAPADAVRILLLDHARAGLDVYGGAEGTIRVGRGDARLLLDASGPLSLVLPREGREAALSRVFPGYRSGLVFPLMLGGRSSGVVLLLFESTHPQEVNLDLLAAMAAQTAAAVENARLYQHAVEDVHTGALRPDYFEKRVAQEIERAEADDVSLTVCAVRLDQGAELARALGTERVGRLMESCVSAVRRGFGADTVICRAGVTELRFLCPDPDRAAVTRGLEEVESAAREHEALVPGRLLPLRFRSAVAAFPDDAASAEFLFDVLETQLVGEPSDDGAPGPRDPGPDVILTSPAMQRIVRTLERVAPADISVLMVGETGTGKEVLADLIHRWSRRASGPMVKVHCAALPEDLLQSELFGHEKGAFTGAHAQKLGRFELASGGTIFLDEIGEVSLDVQVKLLRVLQEREIDRVGGTRPVPVDVRIVAATNRDIEAMVREGAFREDLYYRLQGMMIRVPPLRERRQEIPALVERFREEAVQAGHTRVRGLTAEAMDQLFRAPWPGNVRELRNVVFRAMVLAQGDRVQRRDLLMGEEEALPRAEIGRAPVAAGARPEAADPAAAIESAAEVIESATEPTTEPTTAPATELGAGESERRAEAPADPPSARPEPVVELERPAPAAEPPPTEIPRAPVVRGGRQQQLLELVRARGEITTPEYAEAASVSERTALRDLAALTESGLLVRVGKRRGARYRLADSSIAAMSD